VTRQYLIRDSSVSPCLLVEEREGLLIERAGDQNIPLQTLGRHIQRLLRLDILKGEQARLSSREPWSRKSAHMVVMALLSQESRQMCIEPLGN
jgi:hypothetical protein